MQTDNTRPKSSPAVDAMPPIFVFILVACTYILIIIWQVYSWCIGDGKVPCEPRLLVYLYNIIIV